MLVDASLATFADRASMPYFGEWFTGDCQTRKRCNRFGQVWSALRALACRATCKFSAALRVFLFDSSFRTAGGLWLGYLLNFLGHVYQFSG